MLGAWPLPQHVCGSLLKGFLQIGNDLTLWFDIPRILLRYLQDVHRIPAVGLEMGVISTESQVSFFLPFYTRPMKLLSSAAHPTLSCSASFPGVRVSLRKSLLLEAMTSYFYPLHLVCGLMGLCCYAGGEQWNSSDDDFWAHMRRQGGGRQGEQREPRSMDQKIRLAPGEILPLGRLFSWGVLPQAPVGAQGREL